MPRPGEAGMSQAQPGTHVLKNRQRSRVSVVPFVSSKAFFLTDLDLDLYEEAFLPEFEILEHLYRYRQSILPFGALYPGQKHFDNGSQGL